MAISVGLILCITALIGLTNTETNIEEVSSLAFTRNPPILLSEFVGLKVPLDVEETLNLLEEFYFLYKELHYSNTFTTPSYFYQVRRLKRIFDIRPKTSTAPLTSITKYILPYLETPRRQPLKQLYPPVPSSSSSASSSDDGASDDVDDDLYNVFGMGAPPVQSGSGGSGPPTSPRPRSTTSTSPSTSATVRRGDVEPVEGRQTSGGGDERRRQGQADGSAAQRNSGQGGALPRQPEAGSSSVSSTMPIPIRRMSADDISQQVADGAVDDGERDPPQSSSTTNPTPSTLPSTQQPVVTAVMGGGSGAVDHVFSKFANRHSGDQRDTYTNDTSYRGKRSVHNLTTWNTDDQSTGNAGPALLSDPRSPSLLRQALSNVRKSSKGALSSQRSLSYRRKRTSETAGPTSEFYPRGIPLETLPSGFATVPKIIRSEPTQKLLPKPKQAGTTTQAIYRKTQTPIFAPRTFPFHRRNIKNLCPELQPDAIWKSGSCCIASSGSVFRKALSSQIKTVNGTSSHSTLPAIFCTCLFPFTAHETTTLCCFSYTDYGEFSPDKLSGLKPCLMRHANQELPVYFEPFCPRAICGRRKRSVEQPLSAGQTNGHGFLRRDTPRFISASSLENVFRTTPSHGRNPSKKFKKQTPVLQYHVQNDPLIITKQPKNVLREIVERTMEQTSNNPEMSVGKALLSSAGQSLLSLAATRALTGLRDVVEGKIGKYLPQDFIPQIQTRLQDKLNTVPNATSYHLYNMTSLQGRDLDKLPSTVTKTGSKIHFTMKIPVSYDKYLPYVYNNKSIAFKSRNNHYSLTYSPEQKVVLQPIWSENVYTAPSLKYFDRNCITLPVNNSNSYFCLPEFLRNFHLAKDTCLQKLYHDEPAINSCKGKVTPSVARPIEILPNTYTLQANKPMKAILICHERPDMTFLVKDPVNVTLNEDCSSLTYDSWLLKYYEPNSTCTTFIARKPKAEAVFPCTDMVENTITKEQISPYLDYIDLTNNSINLHDKLPMYVYFYKNSHYLAIGGAAAVASMLLVCLIAALYKKCVKTDTPNQGIRTSECQVLTGNRGMPGQQFEMEEMQPKQNCPPAYGDYDDY